MHIGIQIKLALLSKPWRQLYIIFLKLFPFFLKIFSLKVNTISKLDYFAIASVFICELQIGRFASFIAISALQTFNVHVFICLAIRYAWMNPNCLCRLGCRFGHWSRVNMILMVIWLDLLKLFPMIPAPNSQKRRIDLNQICDRLRHDFLEKNHA